MQAELTALGRVLNNPLRPLVAIVGGAKVSTKLELLNNLVRKVNVLVLGGAMAKYLSRWARARSRHLAMGA